MVNPFRTVGFIAPGHTRGGMAPRHDGVLRLSALVSGTALLVSGPAMSGKRDLLIDLLAAERSDGDERATVGVTTRLSATAFERDFVAAGGTAAELSVVDYVSRQSGFSRVTECARRRHVSGPGDLTGIGIGVSELLRGAKRRDARPWVGMHSLSTMTMYASVDRVFRALHVLAGQVRALDGVLVAALEGRGDGPDEAFGALSQPFDGRLDVRERDDGRREVRGRGASVAPQSWTAL